MSQNVQGVKCETMLANPGDQMDDEVADKVRERSRGR